MNKLKFNIDKQELEININNIKILFGDNYIKKYQILKKIEQYIFKESNSEYNKEYSTDNNILLNNNILSPNDCMFIRIDSNFDIINDLKLGTKSLSLKYLESKLKNIEYEETFFTISKLFESLNDEYINNTSNIDIDDVSIKYNVSEFNLKKMIKLIEPIYEKEDLVFNNYDLTYYEILKLQIKIISEIAKNTDKTIFVGIDNYIDKKLLDYVYEKFSLNNVFCLILYNCSNDNITLNDYLLVNNNIYDLNDEICLYNYFCMELPFNLEMNDLYGLFINYIKGQLNDKTIELIKLL